MNYEQILEKIEQQQPIDERTVAKLCRKIQQIMVDQSNLLRVAAPVNLVGDVHGQFYDVLKLFRLGGSVPEQRYLFIGDYVDRGYNSFETIVYLFCLKILYPDRIYMTRGNHESRYAIPYFRQISCAYGFHEEINRKYGNANLWKVFNQTFDYLPLGAVIEDEIFCIHGGLSPDIHALDQIREINRVCEIPTEGAFADLMWSDPQEIDKWAHGSRGAGWLFGHQVVSQFNQHNGLKLIARAHQLAQEGFCVWFPNKNLVTVWSAPNYCYRCNNLGAFMKVHKEKDYEFVDFSADDRSKESVHYRTIIPYFL